MEILPSANRDNIAPLQDSARLKNDLTYYTIPEHEEHDLLLGKNDDDEGSVTSSISDHDDDEQQDGGVNKAELFRLVAVAATTAATLGYDVGIMAAAIQPIQAEMELSGVQKELAMGSLNFTAALGTIIAGHTADKYGRKFTVALTCWLFLAGTACMTLAPSYGYLLLGRIVCGLGVGVAVVVAPVFISEVAPTEVRGQLNSVFDVAINGGILVGYIVGFLVQISPIRAKWRVMLALGGVTPILVLLLLSPLPESPRWLMLVDDKPAAESVMEQLGVPSDEVTTTIQDIQRELWLDRQQPVQWWGPGQKLAVNLGFWQQITGTETVLYYSADFLARAGLRSPAKRLLGNIFVGISKLVPELLAMAYVDVVGRRPLLIGSAAALLCTMSMLSASFYFHFSALTVVVLLCSVMASYGAGIGPFTFLCASENLALSERATGMTMCAAANRCTSGLVALTAVSLYEWLGDAGVFALYSVFAVGSLAFYSTVPETSGMSLEELSAMRSVASSQVSQGEQSSAIVPGAVAPLA